MTDACTLAINQLIESIMNIKMSFTLVTFFMFFYIQKKNLDYSVKQSKIVKNKNTNCNNTCFYKNKATTMYY